MCAQYTVHEYWCTLYCAHIAPARRGRRGRRRCRRRLPLGGDTPSSAVPDAGEAHMHVYVVADGLALRAPARGVRRSRARRREEEQQQRPHRATVHTNGGRGGGARAAIHTNCSASHTRTHARTHAHAHTHTHTLFLAGRRLRCSGCCQLATASATVPGADFCRAAHRPGGRLRPGGTPSRGPTSALRRGRPGGRLRPGGGDVPGADFGPAAGTSRGPTSALRRGGIGTKAKWIRYIYVADPFWKRAVSRTCPSTVAIRPSTVAIRPPPSPSAGGDGGDGGAAGDGGDGANGGDGGATAAGAREPRPPPAR